ncbi:efflux RND transporter periplasmic adaptor subunit [Fulvivirga kasyanovii]|uniref:Efflux RND transporter periplasmic adaptor subunit n=1 Tax=Fulvivirga kasyanovii TaxID=396812 RepID=A0ABW9RWH8_9BACT|nr:efflux RND transporter periplasmic adaptor subunit [Fulvivirga kasyanovii]MTI27375.1 efflux RND transporter periplasmic adaptor subunit [Fulvivirga kasyanovii]
MKIKLTYILLIISAPFLLSGCGQTGSSDGHEHEHAEEKQDEHVHGDEEEHAEAEGVVELNAVQIANAGLQYGGMDTVNISAYVKANGTLDLPPQNIAAVSAPMDGFVKKANYLVGDYVKKGTVLAVLEHMDYIKLQEEYLSVINNLSYLESEYQRQKQLDSARVTAKKQYQAASAAYEGAMARKKALEKQLQYMGLSPKRVASGEISATINIRAPLSGHITALNVHNGAFAEQRQELYEIVDTDHMHLELNVFEQDISEVKVGQPISFAVPAMGEQRYKGEVFLVGKSFDQQSKTVKVHAHIGHENHDFIRGYYAEAKIYTEDKRIVALPEDAVVSDEGKSFIFILTEDAHEKGTVQEDEHGHEEEAGNHEEAHGTSFKRVQVVTGEKDQGFVQIAEVPELMKDVKIVTRGAYYLLSEMKKGEGGHHHH